MSQDHVAAERIAYLLRGSYEDIGNLARCYLAFAQKIGAEPLTARQREIFDFIAAEIDRNGYAPCFEEIAAEFGYKSLATVHEHLVNIERKGWIVRSYGARGIQIVAASLDPEVAA